MRPEHSSLQGRSPAAVWEHYASPESGLIRLPGDDTDDGNTSLQLFENFSGRCQEVTLQKKQRRSCRRTLLQLQ